MKRGVTLTFTPTTNTAGGAHTAGDAMASLLTIDLSGLRAPAGTPVWLLNALITDLDAQNHDADLILFSSLPASTVTGNTAFDCDDADLPNIIGVVNIDDYAVFVDNGVNFRAEGAMPVPLLIDMTATSPTIYGVLVTRGTPTYSGTSAIKVKLTFGINA